MEEAKELTIEQLKECLKSFNVEFVNGKNKDYYKELYESTLNKAYEESINEGDDTKELSQADTPKPEDDDIDSNLFSGLRYLTFERLKPKQRERVDKAFKLADIDLSEVKYKPTTNCLKLYNRLTRKKKGE